MRRGSAIGTVAAVLLALADAGPAMAAEASFEDVWSRGVVRGSKLVVRDRAGEANRLTVTDTGDTRMRVRDDATALAASPSCERAADNEVICPAPSLEVLEVYAGSGDDEVRIPFGWAFGGPGSDLLVGGERSDVLEGEEGSDTLMGLGGNDALYEPGPLDGVPDTIAGGQGHDSVGYGANDAAMVSVDLRTGAGPEGDRITEVEDATVISADSAVLSGDSGFNRLRSFGGRSVLEGRGGDDVLFAESELRDRLDGGDGDDALQLHSYGPTPLGVRETDVLECGAGTDVVWLPSPGQLIPDDCERVGFDEGDKPRYRMHLPLARRSGALATVAPGKCPTLRGTTCRFTWVVRAGSRLIARRTQMVRSGRRGGEITLRLSAEGQRLLRTRGRLRASIGIQEPRRLRHGFRFDLRAP